jgi:hypothetical protein
VVTEPQSSLLPAGQRGTALDDPLIAGKTLAFIKKIIDDLPGEKLFTISVNTRRFLDDASVHQVQMFHSET